MKREYTLATTKSETMEDMFMLFDNTVVHLQISLYRQYVIDIRSEKTEKFYNLMFFYKRDYF